MNFAQQVLAACAVFYTSRRDGWPPIDPVVFFKLAMVGFFEGLQSHSALAARAEDSLSVRAFLGYALEEHTPDHSSLSTIARRLGKQVFSTVLSISLQALKAHGLLKAGTWASTVRSSRPTRACLEMESFAHFPAQISFAA